MKGEAKGKKERESERERGAESGADRIPQTSLARRPISPQFVIVGGGGALTHHTQQTHAHAHVRDVVSDEWRTPSAQLVIRCSTT